MRTEKEIEADAKEETPFSNHTSYEIWQNGTCFYGNGCVHDYLSNPRHMDGAPEHYCPLITVALLGKTPQEWLKESDADAIASQHYHCTERQEAPDTVDDHESPPDQLPVGPGWVWSGETEPLPGQGGLW